MSAWFQSIDLGSIFILFEICILWAAGGWLLVRSMFSLRPSERLSVGVAVGFVLFLVGVNLLTRRVGLAAAAQLVALVVFAGGLVAASRPGREGKGWARLKGGRLGEDLHSWPQLAWLLALTLLFMAPLEGLSIFDETTHMPLVSIMGTGDIPPHFYLDPSRGFAYHYGLHVFSAVLEATGRFFPWSAWDLGRALALALCAVLGWLWVRRWTGSSPQGILGSLALVFGGGTRWLLLLLPGTLLAWMAGGITQLSKGATGPSLVQALGNAFLIDGQGNLPFPFAFHNGLFMPVSFSLGGSGAMAFFTILVLLLLARRPASTHPAALLVLGLVFSSLALSAETIFAFWWVGFALALGLSWGQARRRRQSLPAGLLWGWMAVLGGSALLSALQGGFITETALNLLERLLGQVVQVSNLYGFSLRWPPAIPDIHLGLLSLFSARQLLVLVFEIGPVVLLAPLAIRWTFKMLRGQEPWSAGLGLAALGMGVFPLFFQYGLDVQMYRFLRAALWIWLALGAPALAFLLPRLRPFWKAAVGIGYGVTVFGGLALFAIELTAAQTPQPSFFIDQVDVQFTRLYWNQLESEAQVLSANPELAGTVFGRASRAGSDIYQRLPDWQELVRDPLPQQAAQAGFSYVYMSEQWWKGLSASTQAIYLENPCVKMVKEISVKGGLLWRRLLDISACK